MRRITIEAHRDEQGFYFKPHELKYLPVQDRPRTKVRVKRRNDGRIFLYVEER